MRDAPGASRKRCQGGRVVEVAFEQLDAGIGERGIGPAGERGDSVAPPKFRQRPASTLPGFTVSATCPANPASSNSRTEPGTRSSST